MSTHNRKNYRRMAALTTTPTPARITRRSRDALLPFALLPSPQSEEHADQCNLSSALLNRIHSAPLTLITGPSGAGKSTLLRALQQTLPNTLTPDGLPTPHPTSPIVNLFAKPLNQTLALLSIAGLAEPKLWALPAPALSAGEQARLTIARLLDRAQEQQQPNTTILIDELATPLDRLTARSLCASINKLAARHPSPRIIAAAAHEDLPTFLNTNLLINAVDHSILPNQHKPETITYEPATIDDHHALKHHHYLGADPKSIARIDRAVRTCPVTNTQILAGVLVVAYPTLNASHRQRAWPNRYTTKDKSANAKRINQELRRIARVIVAPHSRGLSIASTLVRNYLANPLTPATEALAAMGSTNPFFKAAGMTEYPIPHTPTDHRLLDCLHYLNLSPHNLLESNSSLPPSPSLLGEGWGEGSNPSSPLSPPTHLLSSLPPLLQRELKTWTRAKNIDPHHESLPTYAAFKLLTQPRAYTHVKQERTQ